MQYSITIAMSKYDSLPTIKHLKNYQGQLTYFHQGRYIILILTRRRNTSIMINDDICLTITGTKGNQVWIGIDAPIEVVIYREEIYKRIKLEKRQKDDEGYNRQFAS